MLGTTNTQGDAINDGNNVDNDDNNVDGNVAKTKDFDDNTMIVSKFTLDRNGHHCHLTLQSCRQ